MSLLVTDHFSIDVDLRSFYIRGNPGGLDRTLRRGSQLPFQMAIAKQDGKPLPPLPR